MTPRSSKHPERVLFIRTDRLGETVLNLPAVAALHQGFPKTQVMMLVSPDIRQLLEGAPAIHQLMEYHESAGQPWWGRAVALARQWRRQRFDVAIVSNAKKEFHLATWLAGIPRRIGYDRKWGCLLTDRLPDRKALGERHEVEYNLDLVRRLGVSTEMPRWQWPSFGPEQRDVREWLTQNGIQPSELFVTIHPWTSNPLKQWPLPRYRELIRVLSEQQLSRVVVVGGPEEASRARAVLPEGLPIVNFVGRLTLRHLAALLGRTRVLVSNDSGPVHLAAAMHTKTLVLFGASSAATGPKRWGPWGEGHLVIWKPSMDAITLDEVVTALKLQLT